MVTSNIDETALYLFNQMVAEAQGNTPNEVKAIIKEAIQHEGVKELLTLVYDPLIKYNITLPHDEYAVNYDTLPVGDADQLIYVLTALYTKEVRSRKEKEALVWDYIQQDSPNIIFFIRKSLDIGFGLASARELGIVSAHMPQKGVLCKSYHDISYPTYVEYKYNGSRLSLVKENGVTTCKLLKGNVIKIPALETIMNAKVEDGITLDGELCKLSDVHHMISGGVTEADRIHVSGLITSALSTKSLLLMEGLVFVAYDKLWTDVFVKALRTEEPYSVRRNELVNTVMAVDNSLITISTMWAVKDASELKSLVDWVKELGGEGLMEKKGTSTYDYKKNSQWHKIKNIKEIDMEILDWKEHTRNPNWIGSLLCKAYLNGREIRCWTGSGLNDNDRPVGMFDKYKGKIVSVSYLDEVSNKDGGWSVSNPRFLKDKTSTPLLDILRPDGNNVNY